MNVLKLTSLFTLAMFAVPVRGEPPSPNASTDDTLPTGAIARLGDVRFLHGERCQGLTIAPDGSQVLAADEQHIRLWDAKSGRQLREFTVTKSVRVAKLSPDGKTVAAVENGQKVWLWDAATGNEMRRLTMKGEGRPDAMCWSPDSKWIVSSSGDAVYVWEADTGKEIYKLAHGGTTALAVSHDRKFILTVNWWNNELLLWDMATGKILRKFEGTSGAGNIAFAPDDKTVVGYCEVKSGSVTRTSMRTWDVATGERLRRDFAGGWHALGGFSPDGKTVFAGREDVIYVWDAKSRGEVRKWKTNAKVGALSLSADGKWLAGYAHGRVRIWDTATGKEPLPPTGHTQSVTAVSFAPDGKSVASVSADSTVRVWDWTTGKELLKHSEKVLNGFTGVTHLPDGKLVLFAAWNGNGSWWVYDSIAKRTVKGFEGDVNANAIVVGKDGKVLTAGFDGCIGLWDVAAGKEEKRIDVRPKPSPEVDFPDLRSLSLSADCRRAAWTDGQKRAGVVDLETGKTIVALNAPEDFPDDLERIAYSPDGSCLATNSWKGYLRLWRPETGKPLVEWPETAGAILTFSPDGRFIAVANTETYTSNKRDIAIWDIAARKECARFRGHRGPVTALAFEPRGRVLVSASEDGTLLVWDLTGAIKEGKLPKLEAKEDELSAAWNELGSADSITAQKAVVLLARAAPQSVALIGKNMKPVAPADPARVQALIAKLGDDDFKVREQAGRDLSALGEAAEPALRQGLKSDSPEVRSRCEALLRPLGKWELSAEQARTVRAVAALEYAGGHEARSLLQKFAEGDSAARLTRSAKASLERVSRSEREK